MKNDFTVVFPGKKEEVRRKPAGFGADSQPFEEALDPKGQGQASG
jgi:hypothetical protein